MIAFQERAQVFTTVVEQDRWELRETSLRNVDGWGRQNFVTIHRTSVLQVCPTPLASAMHMIAAATAAATCTTAFT